MKLIKLFFTFYLSIITLISYSQKNEPMTEKESIYDININSLSGEEVNFNDFKGKYLLIVNVASECGFTPQYEELQKLHETYKDKLVVIGVPCNQFGGQEPGDAEQIQSFCEKNYGVEFLITQKVDVKGDNQHPLYKWLTLKELNGESSSSVKWNFQKYLINKEGNYIDVFYSITKPLNAKITGLLK